MFSSNRSSALTVARATGAAMVVAAEAGLAVEEYSPTRGQERRHGHGQRRQGPGAAPRSSGSTDCATCPTKPDAADAIAVALTHLTAARMRRVAARVGAR